MADPYDFDDYGRSRRLQPHDSQERREAREREYEKNFEWDDYGRSKHPPEKPLNG